jgi:hypothetical protein
MARQPEIVRMMSDRTQLLVLVGRMTSCYKIRSGGMLCWKAVILQNRRGNAIQRRNTRVSTYFDTCVDCLRRCRRIDNVVHTCACDTGKQDDAGHGIMARSTWYRCLRPQSIRLVPNQGLHMPGAISIASKTWTRSLSLGNK